MGTGEIDLDYLQHWTRREPVILTETLNLRPALTLAAMLDQPGVRQVGDILPPLWQWVYFTPIPLASQIGVDGHPVRGGFLPPVPLPRRMWAASSIVFKAPLRLGETVQKQSHIFSVELKQGLSGTLVFVTVDHRYSVEGELRVCEEQTLVYTGKDQKTRQKTADKEAIEPGSWSRLINPDSVMLFRYSALTGNTHRIHYDRDYATREEAYPGLLVQAPWTATLLAELLREHCPAKSIIRFSFRAIRPLTDTESFMIHGHRKGDEVSLKAVNADGQLAVRAKAALASL